MKFNPILSVTITQKLNISFNNFLKKNLSLNGFIYLCAKESTCNVGDLGLIPGLRRSPGEGNGYPLQYSGLENLMDCMVRGVAKTQTRLSNFHFHFFFQVASVVSDSW